jgi:hypothetical protein
MVYTRLCAAGVQDSESINYDISDEDDCRILDTNVLSVLHVKKFRLLRLDATSLVTNQDSKSKGLGLISCGRIQGSLTHRPFSRAEDLS